MKEAQKRPPDVNGRSFDFVSRARVSIAIILSITVAMLLSVIIFDLADDALALTRHGGEGLTVTVSRLSELPEKLKSAGIIKHPQLFSLYVALNDKDMRRSSARVSPDMDYRALLAAFTDAPRVGTLRITIPKSACVSDIIEIFVSNGIGSRRGFIKAINEYPFEFDFIDAIPESDRVYRLEGYLYPDTYDFYTGRSESYYIERMLSRFDAVTEGLLPLCEEAGTSLDELVTVASLIECSAGFSSSYERLSGVIHNRLDRGDCLQIPAASVYGISASSELYTGEVTDELTKCDSPYNTFTNKGLPPGAVCNPSKEALLCALYPEKNQYLYFVTQSNGNVLFAKSLSEHRENLASR